MDKKKTYPKRGEDCEQEDCMWHTDGWCDRPNTMKCEMEKSDTKKKD